ncbi:hypothetical protein AAG663_02290 [Bacillus licheniformis]
MSNIEELRLFRKEDIEWLQTWFEDAEVKRRLEGMLPLDEWFNFAGGNEKLPGMGGFRGRQACRRCHG